MSLLAHLTRTADIEPAQERSQTTRKVLPSGVDTFTIEYAYINVAATGAIGIVFKFVSPNGGFTTTEWVQSCTAKGGTNYYVDKNGKRQFLPGFTTVNNICRLTLDKELSELDQEEKAVMIWDAAQRKEVPQMKEVLIDLCGQEITLGIHKVLEDQFKEPTKYRTTYEIETVFHTATGCVVTELEAGLDKGTYIETFKARNTGEAGDRDKRVQSKGADSNPQPSGSTSATKPAATSGATNLRGLLKR